MTEKCKKYVLSDKLKLIDDFRKTLEEHAKKNNLSITNIKGWTNKKIEWMAVNENKCCCAPDKRVCPCEEGINEAAANGTCLCSVFEPRK